MQYGRGHSDAYDEPAWRAIQHAEWNRPPCDGPPRTVPPRPEHDHTNHAYHTGTIGVIRDHHTGRHTLTARQLAIHLHHLAWDAHNAHPHRAQQYTADLHEAQQILG